MASKPEDTRSAPRDAWAAVRFFTTEGPVVAGNHYCLPALDRIDLDESVQQLSFAKSESPDYDEFGLTQL